MFNNMDDQCREMTDENFNKYYGGGKPINATNF